MTDEKPRTQRQNRALHLLFGILADQLNEAGLDMKKTLRKDVEIPWTASNIKEFLWRPVMTAQLGKKSTTEMTTKDIDRVFETLTRHLGQKFSIELDFPSIESLSMRQRTKEK